MEAMTPTSSNAPLIKRYVTIQHSSVALWRTDYNVTHRHCVTDTALFKLWDQPQRDPASSMRRRVRAWVQTPSDQHFAAPVRALNRVADGVRKRQQFLADSCLARAPKTKGDQGGRSVLKLERIMKKLVNDWSASQ
jgi:hypothetical protein